MTSAVYSAPAGSYPVIRSNVAVRIVAYLVLIDLLILPYFRFLVMPMSLGLVVAWAFFRFEIRVDRELRLFFLIAACTAISAGLTILYRERPIVLENVKRAGQLLTSFAYYFFFRRAARDVRFNPAPALMLFILWFAGWAIFFFLAPAAATSAGQRFYSASAYVEDMNLVFFRFAYCFADPNTAAYLVAIVGVFLLQFGRLRSLGIAFVLLVTVGGVMATGSRGAAVALVIAAGLWAWRKGIIGRNALRFGVAAAVIFAVFTLGLRWYGERHPDKLKNVTRVYKAVSSRVAGGSNESLREVLLERDEAAGASRVDIYRTAVTNFWPLPLGRGYELTGHHPSFRPHSDILRVLYAYGFVALIAMWVFFFRDLWRLEFAIPALTAFAINTLIDEQKVLAVFLALVAIARVKMDRTTMRKHQA